jgi:hypothetical protein
MTTESLNPSQALVVLKELARKHQRSVIDLRRVGRDESPIGVWRGNTALVAVNPDQPLWITIDLQAHPNERTRREGVLMVFRDFENRRGIARFWSRAKLADVVEGGTRLGGVARAEAPPFEIVMSLASKTMEEQLTGRRDADPRYYYDLADPAVAKPFQKAWHDGSPFSNRKVLATLGGGRYPGRRKHRVNAWTTCSCCAPIATPSRG